MNRQHSGRDGMKRMLYWIGLLTIAILALMPNVLALPFSSASKALAQGSADQNPSAEQYSECSLTGISGEDFDAARGTPAGTQVYDCENFNDMSQDTRNDTGNCALEEGLNDAESLTGYCTLHAEIESDPPEESTDPPNSRNSQKDRGSQQSRQCRHLLTDANDTEVSVCGGNIVLLEFANGSKSLVSREQFFQQAGDQQQDGDQQQAGDQQQDGGQQGDSAQGLGCEARV